MIDLMGQYVGEQHFFKQIHNGYAWSRQEVSLFLPKSMMHHFEGVIFRVDITDKGPKLVMCPENQEAATMEFIKNGYVNPIIHGLPFFP